jgi:hypothetical protein
MSAIRVWFRGIGFWIQYSLGWDVICVWFHGMRVDE